MFRQKVLIAKFTKEVTFFANIEEYILQHLDEGVEEYEDAQRNCVASMERICDLAVRWDCDRNVVNDMHEEIKFFKDWVSNY